MKKANLNGRSSSYQRGIDKTNTVSKLVPILGRTAKMPPVGGSFVKKEMSANAE